MAKRAYLKKMITKILALTLVLVMMLPGTVFAGDDSGNNVSFYEDVEQEITGRETALSLENGAAKNSAVNIIPAEDESKDETPVPEDKSMDGTAAPTDEPKEETPAPANEQKDEIPVPADEPKDETSAPTDEPKDETSAPGDEPKDETPAFADESEDETPEPDGESEDETLVPADMSKDEIAVSADEAGSTDIKQEDLFGEAAAAEQKKAVKKTCTVTLNLNGGKWPEDEERDKITVTAGAYVDTPGGILEKRGYYHIGWSDQKSGGTIYDDSYPVTEDVTLYARYEKAYILTLNFNGGQFYTGKASQEINVRKGTSIYLKGGDLNWAYAYSYVSKEGYVLAGWTKKKNTGTVISGQYTPARSETLYARWVKAITITLNAGKGAFVYANTSLRKEKTIVGYGRPIGNPNMPVPKWEGHEFAGWYLDKACTKPLKKTSVFKKATTLYARWETKKERLKVTVYNVSGASYIHPETGEYECSSDDSFSFFIDKGSTVNLDYLRKSDAEPKLFLDKGFKIPYYSEYIPTKNIKLYVKWNKRVTVSWNGNGGTNCYGEKKGKAQSIKSLMCENLPDARMMRRTGYAFAGWYLSDDPQKKILPASHVFTKNASVKAKWVSAAKVTVDLNGGTFYGDRTVREFYVRKGRTLGSVTDEYITPIKGKYVFVGWKNSVTNKTVKNPLNEIITEDTVFRAKWVKSEDAAMVTLTLKITHGSMYSKSRYKYCSTVKYKVRKKTTEGELIRELGKVILSEEIYTVNLNSLPFYNDPAADLVFIGWSAEKENGKLLSDTYRFTTDLTLYPVWKKSEDANCTVALVTRGGSYKGSPQNIPVLFTVVKSTRITLPTKKEMEREGYTFAGWYSDAKCTEKLSNQKTYKVKGTVFLFAKWTKK